MSAKRDVHHILWQKRHWDKGWSKRLREHPYCKIEIPRDTLHHQIHQVVNDIPVPNGEACKAAYIAIESWLEGGVCSMDDNLSRRIEVIEMCFKAKYPVTYKALEKQKNVVDNYYKGAK